MVETKRSRPATKAEIRAWENEKYHRAKARKRRQNPNQLPAAFWIFLAGTVGLAIFMVYQFDRWLHSPWQLNTSPSMAQPAADAPYSCRAPNYDAAHCAQQKRDIEILLNRR
jgi:hypothetical protein